MNDKQMRMKPVAPWLETRADGRPRIVGHAAVFNSWTTLAKGRGYELREIIRPGAFRNAISEGQDVRALFDHDASKVLGRTRSGSCRLREDARGLLTEIDPPDTTTANDVVELIRRGDVTGMSFAFVVRPSGAKQTTRRENGIDVYETEILDVDLFDVSVVTYPAYSAADVAVRCGFRGAKEHFKAARQARLDRLRRELAGV